MKKSILSFLALFLFNLANAQQQDTRILGSFSELSVSEGIQVTLLRGSVEKAEINTRNVAVEEVVTKVTGNELKIYLDGNNYRNIDVEVRLTYRELEEISISSAAKVYGKDPLTATSMEIDMSSAARAELVLDAGQVEIDISSAANLSLEGKADEVEVDVSSAGELEAVDLTCRMAEVSVSSAGSVSVTVTDRLEAEASSGGKIRYSGDPQKVYVNSNSGGSVKKR